MPRAKKPGVEPKRRSRNGCWYDIVLIQGVECTTDCYTGPAKHGKSNGNLEQYLGNHCPGIDQLIVEKRSRTAQTANVKEKLATIALDSTGVAALKEKHLPSVLVLMRPAQHQAARIKRHLPFKTMFPHYPSPRQNPQHGLQMYAHAQTYLLRALTTLSLIRNYFKRAS
jgi:hypothetical protein